MDAMLKPYFDGVGSHHNSHQITTFHTELYRSIPIVLKENHCKNRVYRCMPSFAGARDGQPPNLAYRGKPQYYTVSGFWNVAYRGIMKHE